MTERITESSWEREQRRQVESLLRPRRYRGLGECAWTGRTDNTDLGVRDLTPPPVEDDDDFDLAAFVHIVRSDRHPEEW